MAVLQGTTTALVFWFGGRAVLAECMTLGELVAFIALQELFLWPLESLLGAVTQFQYLRSNLRRLDDVLEMASEPSGDVRPKQFQGAIVLEGVSFSYGLRAEKALDGIDLAIAPGARIALVGPSGAGKSTLARLLAGLHVPTEGRIRFDGLDLERLDLAYLRRRIGVVLQDTFLFDDTVRANLALHDPDLPREALAEAARRACLTEVIEALPQGWETRIGPDGRHLSGGQRQRLSLARALVHNPAVLLLDEATSALDQATEARVQAHLAELGCTRITIAHRVATVRDADRILVMEGGGVRKAPSSPWPEPPDCSGNCCNPWGAPVPESIPLQPRAAVLRLIALRRAGRSLPKDFPDPGAGAEQLVEALRRVGLAARVVKAEAKDLPCLDCPTLVEARGGGWFMLLAAARGRIRLEGAEGAISGDAAGLLGDTALDLSPLLPAARTFWGRIGRQLLGSRQDLLFLVRTSLFSQALALAVPAATLLVLDRALPDAAQSLLALTAGGIAVITLFQAWTGWLRQRAVLYLETVLEVSAQRTLVEHILNLPYPVLARTSRADLLQAFYGLENARTLMTGVALGAVLDGLFVLVYPACLVLLFPTAAALVILATLAEAALTLGIGRFLMRIQHQTKDDWERLLAAARESGLDDWVRTLPMGYDSLVPPGGGNMSGGQRQMVALAAVMATPRRILLLDEAMANLDGLRQRRVRESPWIRGKTILYASHAGGFHGEFIEISSV